jgi:acetyl-CoA carboxylase biotin carboxylase subunit
MFHKILIANRGEIAVRVMRACRELGVASVAVYSDADKDAVHTRFADEAIWIGNSAARESYLDAQKVIAAAKQSGAQSIHPGYGFLSENAGFAEAVTAAGLTFIGPPASAIRAMGDKAESKIRMKAAGVPTVPGAENLTDEKDFLAASEQIGYPVLVKAAAGGGGKGMRIVHSPAEMRAGLESARSEAKNAFGDERLLVEKYVERAHHVEIQVFGDTHGNLVHLFERECSVQRRHQKIIEESPSPLLTPEIRAAMGTAAVRAAAAVGYTNAGTVEFIFDPQTSAFYFLEMNTRLQVEHPVTELVTGLDLARWQIRVAAGESFPYKQEDIRQSGHAIECRVYAEDPSGGFLPSTGKLLRFEMPSAPGVRVDSGFAAGLEVTHFYDPLLAKIIVHAEMRADAIAKMQSALRQCVVHGVTTNVDFLQDVLAHPDFGRGAVSTRWVETSFDWCERETPIEAVIVAAMQSSVVSGQSSVVSSQGPWDVTDGFRVGA